MAYNEHELIRACQEGNEEAFGPLYDQYLQRIYSFVYFKTLHRELAEDLTSTAFLKAFQKISLYDISQGAFSSWLYAIASNTITDHFRSHKHEHAIDDVWDLGDDTDIEIDTHNKQLLDAVQAYMTKLKPQQRDILMLRLWEGLSYAEIAQHLNMTEASCKMSFSRTIRELRKAMPLPVFLLLLTMTLRL